MEVVIVCELNNVRYCTAVPVVNGSTVIVCELNNVRYCTAVPIFKHTIYSYIYNVHTHN